VTDQGGDAAVPRILVTLADPAHAAAPSIAARKNRLYLDAIERAGGDPQPIDERAGEAERAAAFTAMDGLLLTGGADLDPSLYGESAAGSSNVEPDRDALELAAWRAAAGRGRPVLGICRGFQAINVFLGGRLVQHVDGHRGASYPEGPPAAHALVLAPGSRLAKLLDVAPGGAALLVNSYHHQAVRPADLATRLAVAGSSPGPDGDLVEAFESADGRFVFGVQCHPERIESTPPVFERLFAAFVDAARAAHRDRPPAG
jgi:putative glutamine amidotransferase